MNPATSWRRLRAASIFLFLAALASTAQEAEVRLVAADQPEQPPCSKLVDFRLSPFGGLIATQWIGGATLNGSALFPLQDSKTALPTAGAMGADATAVGKAGDDALDLELDDLEEETKAQDSDIFDRAIDRIDPLYQGKTFTNRPLMQIGPKRFRHSARRLVVRQTNIIEPGGFRFRLEGGKPQAESKQLSVANGKVLVPCFPLRIRAAYKDGPGTSVVFRPRLSWNGRYLLADLLFEHSQALPMGPPADLFDAKGKGERETLPRFRELTIYLPHISPKLDPGAKPYVLNGASFFIDKDGVALVGAEGKALRTGPFSIVLQLPPPRQIARDAVEAPVFLNVAPRYELVEARGTSYKPRPGEGVAQSASLILRHLASGEEIRIPFSLPVNYANCAVACQAGPQAEPAAIVFGAPGTRQVEAGRLRLAVSAWDANGARPLGEQLDIVLRPFPLPAGSPTPHRLTGRRDGEHFVFDAAKLPPDLYRVRLPSLLSDEFDYHFLVAVAPPTAKGAVSLFTHHNRSDYRQDESVEVTAALRGAETPIAVAGQAWLRHESGVETAAGTVQFKANGKSPAVRFFSLPAAELRPGDYSLVLRMSAPGFLSHRLNFRVYPAEPATTWEGFATSICSMGVLHTPEGVCNYRVLGHSPDLALGSEAETERFLAQPLFPAALAHVCRRDPFFPVPERAEPYGETERQLAAATRLGIDFMPHGSAGWGLGGYTANWNPKHTLPDDLDWMRRVHTLRAQLNREFSSFDGFFLNWFPTMGGYWEGNPARDGRASRRGPALGQAVREAQGPAPKGIGWTRKDGLTFPGPDGKTLKEREVANAGPQDPNFYSKTMEAIRAWKVRGAVRRTQALPLAYEAWLAGAKQLGDWNYVSWVPVFWLRSPAYYPPIYFGTTPRAGVHAYTDWGFEPLMGLFGLDYYAAGVNKPKWLQMMSGGRSTLFRQTLLSAGRGAVGIGLGGGGGRETMLSTDQGGEDYRQINNIVNRYGPYFMALQPTPDVAILRSFHQETADVGKFSSSSGRNGLLWPAGLMGNCYTLYYNLMRSRRPAAFITEEDVAAGKLNQFRGLFLVGQRMLMPKPVMAGLDTFVKHGGRIFRDQRSTDRFPGESVDVGPDKDVKTNVGQSGHIQEQQHLWFMHNYLQCRAKVEAVLDKLPRPKVDSDHHHILLTHLSGRDTMAVFAVNDTFVSPDVNESWQIRQAITMTRRGRLFFDKPYYLYDLLDGGREIALKEQQPRADGRWALPIDFTRAEGRAFIAVEHPVRQVELKASSASSAGAVCLTVEAKVLDDRGQAFTDPLPFEVRVIEPGGKTVKTLYRALGSGRPLELSLGNNVGQGAWTVSATELLSGRQATAALSPAPAPVEAQVAAEGRVGVRRESEVRRFLRQTSDLTIVLGQSQPKAYEEVVADLATAVRAGGKKCSILRLDPAQVWDIPLRWFRTDYDKAVRQRLEAGEIIGYRRSMHTNSARENPQFLYPAAGYEIPGPQFAVYRDVVVIGAPADNRMMADLHAMINRAASDSSPGSDSALVQVTWDAFAPRFAALSLQVRGADGLRAAVEYLRTQLGPPPAEAPPTTAKVEASGTIDKRVELPRPLHTSFGFPISQVKLLDDNRLMVWLPGWNVSGSPLYVLDREGKIVQSMGDHVGLSPMGDGFVQDWRSKSNSGELILRDAELKPLWRLVKIGRWTADKRVGDFFFGGVCRVARVDRSGRTAWNHDDFPNSPTGDDYKEPRKLTAHGVSEDGKKLLVSGFCTTFYLRRFPTGYRRPALWLFDAASGKILWRKDGVMINKSACRIDGDRIVACVTGEQLGKDIVRPELFVWNMDGKELRRVALPEIVSDVRLLEGDALAVVQARDSGRISLLDLRDGSQRALPAPGRVRKHWLSPSRDRIAIATWTRQLCLFASDLTPIWQADMPANISALTFVPGSQRLIAGAVNGHVLWLDDKGGVLRDIDLNPHNISQDDAKWAARYKPDTSHIPLLQIDPTLGRYPSIFDRVGKSAETGASLLANGDFEDGPKSWAAATAATEHVGVRGKALRFEGNLSQKISVEPNRTYVLSLFQRAPPGVVAGAGKNIRFSVKTPAGKELYAAPLPASEAWEERTASFRTGPADNRLTLTLAAQGGKPAKNAAPVAPAYLLDRVELRPIRFYSDNLARQKKPSLEASGKIGEDEGELGLEGFTWKPPTVKQVLPWDEPTGASAGHPPQKIATPFFLMFDGKISGQESSWKRGGVTGISESAWMHINYEMPQKIGLIAVYEDNADARRYTRSFAVFIRRPGQRDWQLVGYRRSNRSPYNLFPFEPVTVDAIMYYWMQSGDNHVRIMEFEAYSADPDFLDL